MPDASFEAVDWLVLLAYLAIVIFIGVVASRRGAGSDEYFLAGRSMPVWAVAISVLATSQSAATFVGGPQQAFAGDLTYLSANLGGLIAVVVVAWFFLPAFYRARVTSIYELLGRDLGTGAQRAASATFMVGRVFASGARLFIFAIPFALVAFGDIHRGALLGSIWIIAIAAAVYTLAGGIRAVIWTDVLQAVVYVGSVCVALVLLWKKIALPPGEVLSTLRNAGKLTVIDAGWSWSRPWNLWAVIFGLSLLNVAAFGTDQDLTQRMLTCRSARRGSASLLLSWVLGLPVVGIFLGVGLLLYLHAPDGDGKRVFVDFIVQEMPAGLRGLMMAGLFAAAMSSLDSALNAMAATTVRDFYRPLGGRAEARASRIAVVVWAFALAGFASFCVWWHDRSGDQLINFALGVMVFAYSGLLGVFLTVLFTKRGSAASAVAALVTGFVAVLLLRLTPLSLGWQMLAATALSFAVCCIFACRPSPANGSIPEGTLLERED